MKGRLVMKQRECRSKICADIKYIRINEKVSRFLGMLTVAGACMTWKYKHVNTFLLKHWRGQLFLSHLTLFSSIVYSFL